MLTGGLAAAQRTCAGERPAGLAIGSAAGAEAFARGVAGNTACLT